MAQFNFRETALGRMMTSNLTNPKWILRNRLSIHPSQADVPDEVGFVPEKITAGTGRFGVHFAPSVLGKAMGMELLAVDTGAVRVVILPDRGMGIWKCEVDGTEFGWHSPVDGPVHPSLVPTQDSSGIGWLEGFDELLVRCGLQSNGAPEFHPNGTVKYPLHGRIANLPATYLEVSVDVENGILDIVGTVKESRFLIYSLELQTRYRFRVGSPVIEVVDTVTNPLTSPTQMQMLYHINIGQPVVQAGSSVCAAFKTLCPRDARAAEGIDHWDRCDGPTPGYAEQVYFMSAASDSSKWSESLLTSADRTQGLAVHFDTRTLPYLNLWKNTAAMEDGYVVGLEPATNFPNPRGFEEKQKRVVSLAGGESRVFRLKLQPMTKASDVQQSIDRINQLQSNTAEMHRSPLKDWCNSV